MLLKSSITSFRIIESCRVDFDPRLTVISGPNGSGKTSLLEALYFAANGRSFRTRDSRKLLRFGDGGFRVSVQWRDDDFSVDYRSDENRKKFTVNGDKEKISDIAVRFPFFAFHHRSMAVVRAGSMDRYRFVNRVLSRFFPGYGLDLTAYRKALYQKRILLKNRAPFDIITPWNRVLQERRERLSKRRIWFCQVLNEILMDDVQIQYIPNYPDRHLDSFYRTEISRGEPVAGSQLDRFHIVQQGRDVKEFSSSGQQKHAFFQVLTSVGQLFQQLRSVQPVLLLDDFDAEFDENARNRNLAAVLDQFQVVVTTTESGRFTHMNPGMVHMMDRGEIATL